MSFAFFDGDNIGDTIEILLLEGKIAEATSLSESLNDIVKQLRVILTAKNSVEIVILGGDDLLIKYDPKKCGCDLPDDIRTIYKNATGISLSCGIGESIVESINNLRLAKLYGKNQIRGPR